MNKLLSIYTATHLRSQHSSKILSASGAFGAVHPEDGGSTFLEHISEFIPNDRMSHPTR
jgi:hypothetical protein